MYDESCICTIDTHYQNLHAVYAGWSAREASCHGYAAGHNVFVGGCLPDVAPAAVVDNAVEATEDDGSVGEAMTPAPHPSVTRPSHNAQLLGQSGPWPERQVPATVPMQTSAKDNTTPSSQDRSRLSGSQWDPQDIRVIAVAKTLRTSLNGSLAEGSPSK